MRGTASVAVIIPALNEQDSIGRVLRAIPDWVDDVIVADNGSTDNTGLVAREHGARVVCEPRRGYGSACLAGIAALGQADVVVFLDADFSDHPDQMGSLVDPIVRGEADLVIGSRVRGEREPGALPPQSRFGNWLACNLLRLFWKVEYTDLGPFRAIRRTTLEMLDMRDPSFGWTVEMQVKAARRCVRALELPVSYRKRIGKSKITGTVKGAAAAGIKILSTIFAAALDSLLSPYRSCDRADRVILFTRYPEAGNAKTRLIPKLGGQGAADLQRNMTEFIARNVQRFVALRPAGTEVRFAGGDAKRMRAWLGNRFAYAPQGEGDLGVRMARAFRDAFVGGAGRCVIIGSDCPDVTPAVLADALDALNRCDLVLGPATDGGYYLIGLVRSQPELFRTIRWGTGEVMQTTLEVAARLGLRVRQLAPLDDVDRPEDLPVWDAVRREPGPDPVMPRISVIIPALNEARAIGEAIGTAECGTNVEIIVVDGGSTDPTVSTARAYGVKVLTSPLGRATQMNAGAAEATGEVLLFLHADTRLPAQYDAHVRRALERPGVGAGAFRLRIDAPNRSLRIIERLANWRSRRLGMPYGDQAVFVHKGLFDQIGGYPDLPIMEDFELMRRLRRRTRVALVPASIQTSPRRWLSHGIVRTTAIHQIIIAAYYLGVPPARIARWARRRVAG